MEEKRIKAGAEATHGVLVVEDQLFVLELLRRFLSRAGLNVFTAASGEEALAIIDLQQIDLALVDFRLPDLNAIELICRIGARGRTFPIIVMSGYASEPAVEKAALDAGAAAYLPKGIGMENIVCRVRSFLPPIAAATMEN